MAQQTADQPTKRPWIVDFYLSTVGMKWVMALTGVMLFGFVLFHMLGNIKVYLPDVDGVPDLDVYAEWLRNLLVPFVPETLTLWIMRAGLIAATALHLHATVALTRRNLDARGDRSNTNAELPGNVSPSNRPGFFVAVTATGSQSFSAMTGIFVVWQAMSPRAPVPKSTQPRHLNE